jgi:3-oxoacid CoA-transferase B subunit
VCILKKQLSDVRVKIAKRVAEELKENQVVNLGVGIPTLVPDYIGEKSVFLQSENGLLGMGPTPSDDDIDMDLISASKKPVTMGRGASLFDSADSFGMIRGGHVDVAVLGGLQVDETGEIANWAVPGQNILGVGGAMDLVIGAKKIIMTMTHQAKDGSSKLVKKLTFPRSGVRKVDMVITEKCVFEIKDGKMYCTELLENFTIEELKAVTEADFEVALKITQL